MKVAIIEDEIRATNRLEQLLKDTGYETEVVVKLETVREVVSFNWQKSNVDLIFLDIHLADGSSFEVFKHVTIDIPIIFTTAYDQYALEAFTVNSVDYLLKPISRESLRSALDKWSRWKQPGKNGVSQEQISQLLDSLGYNRPYTRNLLVAYKHRLVPVSTEDLAAVYIEGGIVKTRTFKNQVYFPEQTLDELEKMLNPKDFYRANRQVILHRKSVSGIESYFNSRLLVITEPALKENVLVSKAKAREFKNWLKGDTA